MIFAALMGRAEIAKMLLAAGADINATDDNGTNALTFAELDWQTTEDIAGMFQIPLTNPEAIKKGKAEIAALTDAGIAVTTGSLVQAVAAVDVWFPARSTVCRRHGDVPPVAQPRQTAAGRRR